MRRDEVKYPPSAKQFHLSFVNKCCRWLSCVKVSGQLILDSFFVIPSTQSLSKGVTWSFIVINTVSILSLRSNSPTLISQLFYHVPTTERRKKPLYFSLFLLEEIQWMSNVLALRYWIKLYDLKYMKSKRKNISNKYVDEWIGERCDDRFLILKGWKEVVKLIGVW